MEILIPLVVVPVMVLGIYRLFELYARRKERIMIIEKMQFNAPQKDLHLSDNLNLPILGNVNIKMSSLWPLRASLLMIGIGLGLIVAFILESTLTPNMMPEYSRYDYDVKSNISNTVAVIYFACVSLFGGIGLLAAYFIEQNKEKKQNS
ncbi:DUF6249 domain-containing protein [Dysgonomonas capnocytophagoides]|uniref:DUF6249 domain-containing protein n=1 Tax=Dysgonomonas capnocytophagoides TaxID=45254 RepID=UPI002921C56A|nr:hypothetical protein DCPSUM001_15510 [Dysgonomonas capnocytophagoides]